MDFEGLFWIALVVFYFIARGLGGKKRSKRGPAPKRGKPRPERSRTAPSSGRPDQELDEALREIRRALGFPVEAEKKGSAADTAIPDSEERRRQTVLQDSQVEKGGRRAGGSERRSAQEADRRRSKSSEPVGARRRDERELARQRELQQRAEAASDRRRGGIPRPEVARQVGRGGAHPLEPGFAEEERFEKVGQHPHDRTSDREPWTSDVTRSDKRRTALRDRLRSTSALQEAFVLKELLDQPLSLRKRRLR